MRYLRQVLFDLRQQPLMTWLSIAGTAIAIFLIMSDYMISNINNVSARPESARSRIVYGFGGEIVMGENSSYSSSLSLELAKELYCDLDGVEKISFSTPDNSNSNISIRGGVPENRGVKYVDEIYWEIYDYDFIEGAPFTKEEVEAGVHNVILPKKVAEHYFGKSDSYLDKEIYISNHPYRVTGIVDDVNPLMSNTAADAFVSHVAGGYPNNTWATYLGNYCAILLLNDATNLDDVKRQVEKRYEVFDARHKKDGIQLIYHNQPWNNEEHSSGAGTNTTPDLTMKHRSRLIAYIILLLIPAINLSSMTRSRMRQRISEIGLRRAFGCTRMHIVADLLGENFIISLFGGAIGLILSILFIVSFSNYFISYSGWVHSLAETMARPSLAMLFSWRMFGVVLIFCFILNVLSAGIPAIKAAFTNPAEAISGNNIHK